MVLGVGVGESFALGEGMRDFGSGSIGEVLADGVVADHGDLAHVGNNNFII